MVKPLKTPTKTVGAGEAEHITVTKINGKKLK